MHSLSFFPKMFERGSGEQMKFIRMQRNAYALAFAVGICLTVWAGATFKVGAAFAFGVVSAISLLFLMKKSRLLHDAALIWDNRILAVPSALISMSGRRMKQGKGETVVSTFGILIGSETFRWGLDGVSGVRLRSAHIDQEWMSLIFGDADRTVRVELLHGMTQERAVLDTAQKLLYETGVTAEIIGW
jgi:hypothetical protein